MVWSQESNPGWIGIGQALLKWLSPILKIELKATLHLHNNLGKHNFFDRRGQQTYVAQASMKWVLMKRENVELEENKLNQLEIKSETQPICSNSKSIPTWLHNEYSSEFGNYLELYD